MTTRSTRFGLKFFAHSQNIDSPESFILPFFTRKVSIVTFSGGGYALSRSQSDKTSNIWYLVSATSTFSLKLVVEWRRLPRFPAKMRLVHARALLSIEEISYSLSYLSWNLLKALYILFFSCVHTLPDSFCANTKTIPDMASVPAYEQWFRRDFCHSRDF